jgi:hypothetical protein
MHCRYYYSFCCNSILLLQNWCIFFAMRTSIFSTLVYRSSCFSFSPVRKVYQSEYVFRSQVWNRSQVYQVSISSRVMWLSKVWKRHSVIYSICVVHRVSVIWFGFIWPLKNPRGLTIFRNSRQCSRVPSVRARSQDRCYTSLILQKTRTHLPMWIFVRDTH